MATCSICLSKVTSRTFNLECGHKFHIKCLNLWRKSFIKDNKYYRVSCPYCRLDISFIRTRSNSCICKIGDLCKILENVKCKNEKLTCLTILFREAYDNYSFLSRFPRFVNVITEKILEFKKYVESNKCCVKSNIRDEFIESLEQCYSRYLS